MFARMMGGNSARRRVLEENFRLKPGDRVLDVGCGPAEIVPFLPEVDYVGIDKSPAYVEAAKRRFGDRATFEVADIRDAQFPEKSFDVVMAMGLIHHLDDDGVDALLRLAANVLAPGGRMVALEAALRPGQNRFARWLIRWDRGAVVRTPEAYAALGERWFERVDCTMREDLLRVPYTHLIIECELPRSRTQTPG